MNINRIVTTECDPRNLALEVLKNCDCWANFIYYHEITICIIDTGKGHVGVGHSICQKDDSFDIEIGRAIAYERARFGKVVHKDLLGRN